MTSFQNSLAHGTIRRVSPDPQRAKSLFKGSANAIESARCLPLENGRLNSIFREVYEGLRQYCEAIGFIQGFAFETHESLTPFLAESLKEEPVSLRFDKYRKIRNGMNYYGDQISIETVQEALIEVPKLIKTLEKHAKIIKK